MTSHVSWSIGFEVSLADSFADHFLEHVNLCVRWCAGFIRKVAPTKTFKRPQKPSKTPTKTIKRQSQKVGHIVSLFVFLHFLATCPKKMEKMARSTFFVGTVLRELCLWRIRSMVMVASLNSVCARASPCFVGYNSNLPGFFHEPQNYTQCRESGSDIKSEVAVLGMKFSRPVFGDIDR